VKISISDIRVTERIRKEIQGIDELAENIKTYGLLNPITVMKISDRYQLLAGLRRLRAAETLGFTEIEVNIVSPKDAEETLRIEISENEQREPFTHSEKLDYGRQLERLEAAKALERKSIGGTVAGRGREKKDMDCSPYPIQGTTRDIVGRQLGMSGRQYARAKYIAANAPPEVMEEIDRGERTIRATYDELKLKEKSAPPASVIVPKKSESPPESSKKELFTAKSAPETPPAEPPKFTPKREKKLSDKEKEELAMAALPPKEREAVERNIAFAKMTDAEKVVEIQRQLREERTRAAAAESELSRLKDELHNAVYHRDGIIKNLETRNENLETALAAANARIKELEEKYESV